MAFLEEGGAAYVPPDLLTDSSDYNIDKNFFDVVVTDLKVDTDYNFQFAWVYEDKTVSAYSANYAVTTLPIVIPEVSNIITQWTVSTLNIFFNRPEETIAGVLINRAKSFIITLTALNGDGVSKTAKFTPNVDASQTQQKYEITEARMDTWRKSDGSKFIPPSFTGTIQVVNDDGKSVGLSFTSASNSDAITNGTIADNEWSLTSVLDGYFVNIVPFTTPSKSEFYSYTEVWEATVTGGPYSFVTKGTNPIARVYVSDLTNKYVKIRHVAKAGTYSNYSNEKIIAAANPSGFDATGPNNNNPITPGTPVIDGDGLFDFNYKVPFSWTAETDTTIQGYRIRWRINGSNTGYMTTVVSGRSTTTTMLFGVLAGQTYEVGKNTYDEYGNTTSAWQTTTVAIPAFTGTMASGKFLSAGNMKLGYGIGGKGGTADTNINVNKGLYLGPSNYWYITGNTVTDVGGYLSVGGTPTTGVNAGKFVGMTFDGTDLSITGTINALAGNFTGTVSIGGIDSAGTAIPGQLRVVQEWDTVTNPLVPAPKTGIEIGKLSTTYVTVPGVTLTNGVYAYNKTGGKYVLINAADGSIRANNGIVGGWTISDAGISKTSSYSDPIFGTSTLTTILSSTGTISITSDVSNIFSFGDQSLFKVSNGLNSSSLSPGLLLLSSNTTLNGIPASNISISTTPLDSNSNFRIQWGGGTQLNGYSTSKIVWGNYVAVNEKANHILGDFAYRPLVVDAQGIQKLGPYNYYGSASSTTMAAFGGNGYDGDLYFSTNTA